MEFNQQEFNQLCEKHKSGKPFSKEERNKVLQWKILDILEKKGGECSVGELYKELGVPMP